MKDVLRTYLQKACPSSSWEAWFEPLSVVYTAHTATLTVSFPHVFFQEWFAQKGQELFEEYAQKASWDMYAQALHIEYTQPIQQQTKATFIHSTPQDIRRHDPFAHFIYNAKNEFPMAAIRELAQGILPPKYTPFFIYGKSSTGKTHILHSLRHALSMVHPQEKALFCDTAHTFYAHIEKDFTTFAHTYTFFLVDDMHQYQPNIKIQEHTLAFMDLCAQHHKQLIFTAHVTPQQLHPSFALLRSRLQAGLVVELKEADIDVRMRFVLTLCKEYGVTLSREHMLLLAQQCTTISHVHGVILKIHAFTSFSGKECSTTDFENILRSTSGTIKQLGVQDIIDKVAQSMNIPAEALLGTTRQPRIVRARQIAMFLSRDILGLSYPVLGKYFGGKDHSTVMHSIKKIKELTVTNNDVHIMITEVKQKLLTAHY